jgi:hypothetical protein
MAANIARGPGLELLDDVDRMGDVLGVVDLHYGRWVVTGFAGCFALAAIIQAVGGSAATSSVIAGAFYWLLFLDAPIGYVVWKNWQGRARDVRFTVAGLPGEPGGPIGAVRMGATEDSDDVRATVNALVTMVL